MGFNIRYKDIDDIIKTVNAQFKHWKDTFNNVQNSMNDFVNMESFEGETAESIKAYLEEVHKLLIYSIINVIEEYQASITSYRRGYDDIDSSENTEIEEEELENLEKELKLHMEQFEDLTLQFNKDMNEISDILYMPPLKYYDVMDGYSHLTGMIGNLRLDVLNYETSKMGELLEIEHDVDIVNNAILDNLSASKDMATYSVGDFYNNEYTFLLNDKRVSEIEGKSSEADYEEIKAYRISWLEENYGDKWSYFNDLDNCKDMVYLNYLVAEEYAYIDYNGMVYLNNIVDEEIKKLVLTEWESKEYEALELYNDIEMFLQLQFVIEYFRDNKYPQTSTEEYEIVAMLIIDEYKEIYNDWSELEEMLLFNQAVLLYSNEIILRDEEAFEFMNDFVINDKVIGYDDWQELKKILKRNNSSVKKVFNYEKSEEIKDVLVKGGIAILTSLAILKLVTLIPALVKCIPGLTTLVDTIPVEKVNFSMQNGALAMERVESFKYTVNWAAVGVSAIEISAILEAN